MSLYIYRNNNTNFVRTNNNTHYVYYRDAVVQHPNNLSLNAASPFSEVPLTTLLNNNNYVSFFWQVSYDNGLSYQTINDTNLSIYYNYQIAPYTFTKTNYGSEVDEIIPGQLAITRANQKGIYNSVLESEWSKDYENSPLNTEWNSDGWSNLTNAKSRSYTSFLSAVGGSLGVNVVSLELLMRHIPTQRIWKVQFASWTTGALGGGFSYTRQELYAPSLLLKVAQTDPNNAKYRSVIDYGTVSVISKPAIITINNWIPPSPTPTPTVTSTPTPTITVTPTTSVTPTNTITPTSSITPTVSPTSTVTPTKTPTRTPTPTVTSTITPTPTRTITPTISITPSVTSTITPTPTNTITPTVTITPTKTVTPTSTVTPTVSNTPGITVTPTPSVTPTISLTPTNTVTPTVTRTATPTPTVTPTITPTPTSTSVCLSPPADPCGFVGGGLACLVDSTAQGTSTCPRGVGAMVRFDPLFDDNGCFIEWIWECLLPCVGGADCLSCSAGYALVPGCNSSQEYQCCPEGSTGWVDDMGAPNYGRCVAECNLGTQENDTGGPGTLIQKYCCNGYCRETPCP